MKHLTTREVADRGGNALGRTIVEQVDDTTLMQSHQASLNLNEVQSDLEHVHPYGFTSVAQKPTGSGQSRMGAEGFMGFMGSGRSHGVVLVTGDRRFRLYQLAAGEVALHDDQGQQVHFKRNGIWGSVPNSKQIVLQVMDDDSLPQAKNAQGGQLQQAGRPAQINLTIDKNQFTLNHPNGAVNFNCKTFTVNASSNVKLLSQGYALVSAAAGVILYSVAQLYLKAAAAINVKSPLNLADPDWASGAADPPIES